MQRMIFVNLPVADLAASRAFYAALGFGFNEQFSDDGATYAVVEQNIALMLLTRPRFEDFLAGPIGDPQAATSVLVALSADSREEVDRLADAALAAGGTPWKDAQDHGFMYGRSFRDPSGNVLEVMWMDAAAVTGAGETVGAGA